jgi:hypothetical protein
LHALRPFLLAAILALPAAAAPDWVRRIEDVPGRLELELRPPEAVLYDGAEGSVRVACAGCQAAHASGAPDLPFHRFDVLSGPSAPRVEVHVLESESRSVPGGIAPIPHQLSPTRLENRPDAGLYRQAKSMVVRVSGIRFLRGAPVRGVEIPLALWSEDTRTLTLIRRLKVVATFPDVRPRPASVRLPAAFQAAVENPVGGPWLYDVERPSPLRRVAGAKSAPTSPGQRFVRIRIGDRNVENLGEDQVYGLSFDDLARVTSGLSGTRVENLRLFTGPDDTLPRRMDTLPLEPAAMYGMLREIPLEVVDRDGDGTFESGDSIVFYGHGSSIWKRIPGDKGPIRYEFNVDPYSFENFYFLGFEAMPGAAPARRLAGDPGLAPSGSAISASPHYLRAEQDLETASCDPSSHKDEESGFAWFWHWKGRCDSYFDSARVLRAGDLATDETAVLEDRVKGGGDTVHVGLYVYQRFGEKAFDVWMGGRKEPLPMDTAHEAAGEFYAFDGPLEGDRLGLDSVRWSGQEMRFEGYTVRYLRDLRFDGEPLWIFPERVGTRQTFRVAGAGGASVLRIVDGVATGRLATDAQGRFTDSAGAGSNVRYLVHRGTARLAEGRLSEENLPAPGTAIRDLLTGDLPANAGVTAGKAPQGTEYLIITARPLLDAALALRDYRRDPARAVPLRTDVVLVEDIYRQFGGGRMSPVAIRDFLRWAFHNWNDRGEASPLRHVVLFGDGHYDYRGIHAARKTASPPSLVPPYEFITASGRGEQIATDDFYGWLDHGDNRLDSAMLDIAVGRIPVQTISEAMAYLEKVRSYEDPAKSGEWRARVVLTADDHLQRGAPGDLDPITRGHTVDSERLGRAMLADEPGVNLDRVYLLDYPINASYRKPEAAQDVLSYINRGSLMINYVGHGSSNQWADEVLLQTSDALSRLRNENRTGMVNAFSCTVGRFESLSSEGMSEQFVKQPKVGAIAAVSATRESFPNPNIALASAFYGRTFDRDPATGAPLTVGEALTNAKNSLETAGDPINDLKYALLGEPVLLVRKLPLALKLTRAPDTLRALDCGTLEGAVEGGSGSGMVNVKITAGSVRKDYVLPSAMDPQHAERRGAILFERTLPYKDGKFSTEYFLPRQIAFGDTNARITAFAWDGNQEREGSLAVQDLRIQGTSSSCPADSSGEGPRIRISGCEAKETGGSDFPDRIALPLPYCLQITVEDSTGGVLAAEGPDEGTTVEVPGSLDPFHPLPGIDELYLKSYQLTLESKDFRPGSHVLKVSARDGYGNLSMRQLRMDLTLDSSVTTVTAYNVPNPVKRGGTAFYFSTILPQEEVEVGPSTGSGGAAARLQFEIRIHDQSGRMVRRIRNASPGVRWDGRDEWGNRLANGVYFYTVTARWDQGPGLPNPSYRTLSTRRNTLVLSR